MEPTIIATCSLNQWVLDFKGNEERIIESIIKSKRIHGAKIRVGSQSEIPGFSIEDHYLEPDTIYHSWRVLGNILRLTMIPPYNDILCVIGMPVVFHGVVYNCGIFIYKGRVLLIKPKLMLNDDGSNREKRWFTGWNLGTKLMEMRLPSDIIDLTGQETVPFGNAMLRSDDGYMIGMETMEELQSPISSSTELFLMGAHIVVNIGGSPFEMDSAKEKLYLLLSATVKTGGVYVYSNLIGNDGHRVYFDGESLIALNGNCLSMTDPFSMQEIEIASAVIDMVDIDNYRTPVPSRNIQAKEMLDNVYSILPIPGFRLTMPKSRLTESVKTEIRYYSRSEQIAYAPACFLWDYLRRSGAYGFFIPISGGSDSASVLMICRVMCRRLFKRYNKSEGSNRTILERELKKVVGRIPESEEELMKSIIYTGYLSTMNSSENTRRIARSVSEQAGSTHFEVNIDEIYESFLDVFTEGTGMNRPKYEVHGGSYAEDLALQNLSSRIRMLMTYLAGQLIPWKLNRQGFLVVLGTGNLEESLTGYLTKYDCSSADINPIGGISKLDLRTFLTWAAEKYNTPILTEILQQKPTPELRPAEEQQNDEEELGLTYEEINFMAKIRKVDHCGPLYMFNQCLTSWNKPRNEIADKVKRFFQRYSRNRHKATIATPTLHMSAYGCDDNRFDYRPFLYNNDWERQFEAINNFMTEST